MSFPGSRSLFLRNVKKDCRFCAQFPEARFRIRFFISAPQQHLGFVFASVEAVDFLQHEQTDTSSRQRKKTIDVRRKARRDLLFIAAMVAVACVAVLSDPDKMFEWVAKHKEVQVDEFLVAVVFIGTGFALFSWRRRLPALSDQV